MTTIRVTLLRCDGRCDALLPLLDSAERDRMAAFRLADDAGRFLVGRACLRLLLAERLGGQPNELSFEVTPTGKPFLPGHPIHFNLAHSGDVIAIAIAPRPVGIDVEREVDGKDVGKLARAVFGPAEIAALEAAENRSAAFFAIWTAKEAVLKAEGGGFSLRPQDVSVPALAAELRPLRPESAPVFGGIRVASLQVTPGYCGAVAVRGEALPITLQWRDPAALAAEARDLSPP